MQERDQDNADIMILHRMITYIREEAIRLRIMDVALLLEHAEEAVTAFPPDRPSEGLFSEAARPADHIEH